jgi:hypothetical protein
MSTDLVPADQQDEHMSLLPADLFAKPRQMVVLSDVSTPEKYALIAGVIKGEVPCNSTDWANETLICEGFLAWRRRVSKDGEPVEYGVYWAFVGMDGELVVGTSRGVLEDLPLLYDAFGKPPWPHGKPVTFTRVKTGSGHWRQGVFPGFTPIKEM